MKRGIDWLSVKELFNEKSLEDNAALISICSYPTKEVEEMTDNYIKWLAPPLSMWDDFRMAGNKKNLGAGWHKFEGRYLKYLEEDDDAHLMCKRMKAKARVRPVYFVHEMDRDTYSPARLLAQYIKNSVSLKSEDSFKGLDRFMEE